MGIYDSQFSYMSKITLPAIVDDESNFVLKLTDGLSAFDDYVKSDGSDIIFTDKTKNTKLNFTRIVYNKSTGNREIDVLIPNYNKNGDYIYAYFGNSSHNETQINRNTYPSHTGVYAFQYNVEDYSPPENDGTPNNVSTSTGVHGISAVFNGTTSYISCDNGSGGCDVGAQHTIRFWFRPGNQNGYILARRATGNLHGHQLAMTTAGELTYLTEDSGGNRCYYLSGSGNFSPGSGNWYMAEVCYDSSQPATERIKFFVDGADAGPAVSIDNSVTPTMPAQSTIIGKRYSTSSSLLYEGRLDSLYIIDGVACQSSPVNYYNNQNNTNNWYTIGSIQAAGGTIFGKSRPSRTRTRF
jgi:hypothetical protein